jgi:hypothetical protein
MKAQFSGYHVRETPKHMPGKTLSQTLKPYDKVTYPSLKPEISLDTRQLGVATAIKS